MSTAIYDNIWDIWDEEVVESDIEDGINNFLKSITNALSKTNMRIAELRKLIKRKLKEAKTSPCGTLTEMIEHMNIKREPVVVSACDIQKLLLGEKDLFNMLKFTVQTFCSFILYRISIYSINTKNHAEIILTYCETLKEFLIISQSKNLPFASIVECILMFLEKLLELLHNKDFCKGPISHLIIAVIVAFKDISYTRELIEKEVTNRLITLCKLILRQRKNPESSSGTNYRDLYRHYDDLLINFRLIKAILEFYIDQLDGTEVLTTPKFGNGTDSSKILSELLRDVLEGSPTYLSYAIQEYLFML